MSIFKEIKERVDVKEVCSSYVDFNGGKFALSPFSDEKSPSFTCSQEKGLVSCFSTGWSGDVIKFVAEMEGCSQFHAAKLINERFNLGVEIKPDPNERLYKEEEELITRAAENLNEEAINYLHSRGITDESIKEYRLGYLNGKIFIPIKNTDGRIAGHNSRTINGSGPKYIHSQESAIFKKKKLLANLYEAKKLLTSYIVITEGHFDCIQAQQVKIPAASCLSAHFYDSQAELVLKYFDKVILAFDSDEAGINGTLKAYKVLKACDPRVEIEVAIFDDKDLGECLERNTKLKTISFISWMLKLDFKLPDILGALAKTPSMIELRGDARKVAKHFDLEEEDVIYDVKALQGVARKEGQQ